MTLQSERAYEHHSLTVEMREAAFYGQQLQCHHIQMTATRKHSPFLLPSSQYDVIRINYIHTKPLYRAAKIILGFHTAFFRV